LAAQHFLWIFWMAFAWLDSRDHEVLFVVVPVGAVQWYLAGAFMSGESARLSPRVRRALPQSFLGRMFGTWFNPGAGTGYVFSVIHIWSLALFSCTGAMAGQLAGMGSQDLWEIITVATLGAAYVTAYLGVGRLVVLLLRQFIVTGLVLPLLIHIVIAAFGAIAPAVVAGWIQGFANMDYTALQVTNWAWTLVEAGQGDLWSTDMVPIAIISFAALMLVVHLALAIREVEQTRLLTPQRVVEEELRLHPERAKPARQAASPWDEDG
jgi:large-conductance mechanosensitive channel